MTHLIDPTSERGWSQRCSRERGVALTSRPLPPTVTELRQRVNIPQSPFRDPLLRRPQGRQHIRPLTTQSGEMTTIAPVLGEPISGSAPSRIGVKVRQIETDLDEDNSTPLTNQRDCP